MHPQAKPGFKLMTYSMAWLITYLMFADTLRVMEVFHEPESVKRRLFY